MSSSILSCRGAWRCRYSKGKHKTYNCQYFLRHAKKTAINALFMAVNLALAVMIDTMHPYAPSDLIIHHLFSEQVLMYCLTSAPDCR